jgi:hypothetical protein
MKDVEGRKVMGKKKKFRQGKPIQDNRSKKGAGRHLRTGLD